MEKDDGGPAFPHQPMDSTGFPEHEAFHGMSLRDWFAGQALVGVLASRDPDRAPWAMMDATSAYELADAMLLARTQSKDSPEGTSE